MAGVLGVCRTPGCLCDHPPRPQAAGGGVGGVGAQIPRETPPPPLGSERPGTHGAPTRPHGCVWWGQTRRWRGPCPGHQLRARASRRSHGTAVFHEQMNEQMSHGRKPFSLCPIPRLASPGTEAPAVQLSGTHSTGTRAKSPVTPPPSQRCFQTFPPQASAGPWLCGAVVTWDAASDFHWSQGQAGRPPQVHQESANQPARPSFWGRGRGGTGAFLQPHPSVLSTSKSSWKRKEKVSLGAGAVA